MIDARIPGISITLFVVSEVSTAGDVYRRHFIFLL